VIHLLSTVIHLIFQALFTESSRGEQFLAPLPFSSALNALCSLCCLSFSVPFLFFSFLFCFVLFNCVWWGSVCPGGYVFYPRGGCGITTCCLSAHVLVWVSQTGLELASGGEGALLFSQRYVVWRSFVQAGSLGCQILHILGGFFFLPSVAPASQQDS
jgi:hypothetical protein